MNWFERESKHVRKKCLYIPEPASFKDKWDYLKVPERYRYVAACLFENQQQSGFTFRKPERFDILNEALQVWIHSDFELKTIKPQPVTIVVHQQIFKSGKDFGIYILNEAAKIPNRFIFHSFKNIYEDFIIYSMKKDV